MQAKMIRCGKLLTLSTLLVIATGFKESVGEEKTLVLQNGQEGYAGCDDGATEKNKVLSLSSKNALFIKFDLSAVPKSSAILSASLELYTEESIAGKEPLVATYQLLKPKGDIQDLNAFEDFVVPPTKTGIDMRLVWMFKQGHGWVYGLNTAEKRGTNWLCWDMRKVVQNWVDGEENHGIVILLTSTHYGASTSFVSSLCEEPSRRPKLAIRYNPAAPRVDLGNDFRDNYWSLGKELKLETKITRGNPKDLKFSWKFLVKPPTSRLKGVDIESKEKAAFIPDTYGRYHLQLMVEDKQGNQSTDDKWLIVYRFPKERPRLTPQSDLLKQRLVAAKRSFEFRVKQAAGEEVFALTGEEEIAKELLQSLSSDARVTNYEKYYDTKQGGLRFSDTSYNTSKGTASFACLFDLCHHQLEPEEREKYRKILETWVKSFFSQATDSYCYSQTTLGYTITSGIVLLGESPEAERFLETAYYRWFYVDNPRMNQMSDGDWHYGLSYSAGLVGEVMNCWRLASGENLWPLDLFYSNYPYYVLHSQHPGGFTQHSCGGHQDKGYVGPKVHHLWGYVERLPESPLSGYIKKAMVQSRCWTQRRPMAPEVEERSLEGLPLIYYGKATGQVFMRSDWGPYATWASFRCGPRFQGGHEHYAAGHFTVYKQGYLITEQVGLHPYGAQSSNVHNTLVVDGTNQSNEPGAEGGKIIALSDSPHCTYIAGDMTTCYQKEKCDKEPTTKVADEVLRQFVYLKPDSFVVFDRVRTPKPATNSWLCYFLRKPEIVGETVHERHEDGKVFCQMMLPKTRKVEVRDQWMDEAQKASELASYGSRWLFWRPCWKVVVANDGPAQEVYFLHFIHVGNWKEEKAPVARLIDESTRAGLSVTIAEKRYQIIFNKQGKPGGHVTLQEGDRKTIDEDLSGAVEEIPKELPLPEGEQKLTVSKAQGKGYIDWLSPDSPSMGRAETEEEIKHCIQVLKEPLGEPKDLAEMNKYIHDVDDTFKKTLPGYPYHGGKPAHKIRAAGMLEGTKNEEAIDTLISIVKMPLGYGEIVAGVKEVEKLPGMQDVNPPQEQIDMCRLRVRAINSLAETNSPKAVAALIWALKNDYSTARRHAVVALAKIGDKRAIPALVNAAKEDKDWQVQVLACEALSRFNEQEAYSVLLEISESEDWYRKVWAIRALGDMKCREAVKRLLKLTEHPNTSVRAESLWALGQIGGENSLHVLIKALQDRHWWVRISAVEGLVAMNAKESANELTKMKDDAVEAVKLAAEEAVEKLAGNQ